MESKAEAIEVDSQEIEDDDDGPPPGWHSIPPPPQASPPQPPPSSEMVQLVCGSCRTLLSYPKGARHVKCSSCEMVNLVLEAHEVGQLKCGRCEVLLMYPYPAPSVRCSSCHFVTVIGAHNKRPPWSVIQGYSPPLPNQIQ
ncbi:protein LOL2 [Mercurialis annua]|uniref:protein LOL2 n=1 Tax=Mercurialis annua TaxID=3986 RepID=UPI002160004A|nr:protein LOL2 [Mercurialis annua]